MKLYCYCSYDGSPVGFQLGTCEWGGVQEEMCALSKNGIDPFVRACFENGLVRSGLGKIPNRERQAYFMLVKKLVGKKENVQYYINLAVTADEWNELEPLLNGDLQGMAEEMTQRMQPAEGNEFGYRLKANGWEKIIFGNLCGCSENMKRDIAENEAMYLELRTVQAERLEILAQELGLMGQSSWELSPYEKNVARYGKKLLASKWGKMGRLLAAAVLIVLILAVIIRTLLQ